MAEKEQNKKSSKPQITWEQFLSGAPLTPRDRTAARIVLRSKFDPGKKMTRDSWMSKLKELGFNLNE